LFLITIAKDAINYIAYVCHDQSSEEVLLLNWRGENSPSGCAARDDLGECIQCVEGYSIINGLCTFGCGVLCRTLNF
jgi:hypothetical protein